MAYVFVFEYKNISSFNNVLLLAKEIYLNENNLQTTKTLKFFIANKYDFPVKEETMDNNDIKGIDIYYNNDFFYKSCLEKLAPLYENSEKTAKEYFLFASAKYNFNVSLFFSNIFKKINQVDALWIKKAYDDKSSVKSDDETEFGKKNSNSGFFSKLLDMFSCCGKRKEKNDDIDFVNTGYQDIEIENGGHTIIRNGNIINNHNNAKNNNLLSKSKISREKKEYYNSRFEISEEDEEYDKNEVLKLDDTRIISNNDNKSRNTSYNDSNSKNEILSRNSKNSRNSNNTRIRINNTMITRNTENTSKKSFNYK